MIVKQSGTVRADPVTMPGIKDTTIRWLISKFDSAPNFALRMFTIAPGGRIPLHDHPWEHEIFILSGSGTAFTDERRAKMAKGDAILVPGNEPHGYENDGSDDLVFLCIIPNSGDAR